MTGKTFLLGLTGSIGMGKSTTARMFADLGVPVWDADASVDRLYGQDGAGVEEVGKICPEAIRSNAVDRNILRAAISQRPELLKRLEAAIHPLVAQDRARFIAENSESDVLLFDMPLLFETGADKGFDAVVVVSTSEDEQRNRVLARSEMTEQMLEMILAKQLPDNEKRKQADYVISTDDLETARYGVQGVLKAIRER